MRRIIADLYKIMYGITRMGRLSVFVAVLYATTVNFIILNGIFLLVQDWLPTRMLLKGFVYPYYVATFILLFLIHFWMMLPLKNLSKERKKRTSYWSIAAFTLTALIVLFYIHYRNQLV